MALFITQLCRPQDDIVAFLRSCVMLFVFVWLSTVCWSSFQLFNNGSTLQGIAHTEEGEYGKISHYPDKWVLTVNLGIGAKTNVRISNQQVSLVGSFRENGEWKNVNERYNVPDEFKKITIRSFLGKVIVTAQKSNGEYSKSSTGFFWPWDQPSNSSYLKGFKMNFDLSSMIRSLWTKKDESET